MWLKLFDLVVQFFGLFQVFFYVDQYEKAVVLRAGIYKRTVGPGFRWIIPAGIEDRITVNVVPEPMYIDNQSAHTFDGFLVNWQLGLIFTVTSAERYLIKNENTEVQVNLLTAGIVRREVELSTWKRCREPEFLSDIQADVNRKLRSKGAYVKDLTFVDFANGDADRLWVDGVDVGHGE